MIDDNPTDVELMRRAFASVGIPLELSAAHDGEEGLRLLLAKNEAGSAPPDLILLDLNIPKKDGFQVLEELRAQPDLKRMPVIVFSSSTYGADVDRSYALHANSYIAKPADYEELKRLVGVVSQYWFGVTMLPG